MKTYNRSRTILMGLIAALALSACAPAPQSTAEANAVLAHEVATTPSAAAAASIQSSPASSVLPPAHASTVEHTFYTADDAGNLVPVAKKAPVKKAKTTSVPDDGVEYTNDLKTMTAAIHSHSPGRYIGLPTAFTTTGYPIFPATCTFYDDHSECEVGGSVVDEAYLFNKVVVMRNVDVLNTAAHICGTEICVDDQGNVIGHVSKQMIAWRKTHCTWAPYGTAKCKQ